MPELKRITDRTGIKCIRLDLEQEGDPNQLVPSTNDECTIIKAMHDLFSILSKWDAEPRLRLEIRLVPGKPPPGCSLNDPFSVPAANQAVGRVPSNSAPQEILSKKSRIFWDDLSEAAWWQSLPRAPVVGSVHLPVKDRLRWRQTTIKYMVWCFPNVATFQFEPMEEGIESIIEGMSAQRISAPYEMRRHERLGEAPGF
ncbi:hypothetical protein F4808DRAFT_442184 [Astrocystis sublimbata]|nr:hypothetical protein F4808DRAFT_442184 [Astrocystis sublimbata]